MKAIDYLREMDRAMKRFYNESDDFTSWNRARAIGVLDGIVYMAINDTEIEPEEFDEISGQRIEYRKEIREYEG